MIVLQVLLVTGGFNSNYGSLDSTEILEDISGTWRLTAPLPSARDGLRAASVENNIFVFGENILYYINIKHLIICYNDIMFTMTIYLQEEGTVTIIM